MNFRRVAAVAWKEWREVVRDRLFFTLAFVVPAALMLLFGYGLSFDVEHLPIALVDRDATALSREYAHRFIDSRYFDFKGYVRNAHALEPLLADNAIRAAIIIPERFQERLLSHRPVAVQTLIDGTIPSRAQIAKGYVIAINGAFSTELLGRYVASRMEVPLSRARQALEPVRLEVRYLYNQDVKSIVSIAPKLVMVVLLMMPPFLTAVGIVREKESGAIYNIYASTVSRLEFLVGKLAPYVAISSIDAAVLCALAIWLFGAPFKGDVVFFSVATVAYVTCATGIGLLVSVFVRTQIAAMIVTSILTIVPAFLYSGLLTPVPSLDPGAQVVAHLLPAMYYDHVVVGAFLKGVGFETLWRDVAILVGYAAALLALSHLLFRKRLSA
jgi:ABC-2 type transport system permease protein